MRTVFTGFTLYMGSFTSVTAGKAWWQAPATIRQAFDPALMVPIDLGQSVSKAGQTAQIEDFRDERYVRATTLGGAAAGWPEGAHVGQAYLSDDFRKANGLPDVPPDGSGAPYEYQVAWYWPGTGKPQAGTRYLGFHAQILQNVTRQENGKQVMRSLVAVYRAGTGQSSTPTVESVLNWVDLTDIAAFDASVATGGLTQIGPAGASTGALFISESYAKVKPLDDPKKPLFSGE